MTVALSRPIQPEPRWRMCLQLVLVTLVFATLSASLALSLGAKASPHKGISKEAAAAIAKQIAGYPEAQVVGAERRRVAGSVFPFGRPKDRLVWAVTLQGISLTNRSGVTNRLITGLTVLLEMETGRLIRIDSVPPRPGHLKHFEGRNLEEDLRADLRFTGLSDSPQVTFAQALTADPWPTVIPKAKQVCAYLVTASSPPNSDVPRRASYWVVLAGGFQAHVFDRSPDEVASEVIYVICAWEMPEGFARYYHVGFEPPPSHPRPPI